MSDSTTDRGLTVDYVERTAAFNKRVNANVAKARDAAKQLSRCANRKLYAYDTDDAETLLAELERCGAEVREAFERAQDAPARNAPWELAIAKRARAQRSS